MILAVLKMQTKLWKPVIKNEITVTEFGILKQVYAFTGYLKGT